MNDTRRNGGHAGDPASADAAGGGDEEAAVARLLARAGARADLPADDLESVRAAALGAWRSRYGGYVASSPEAPGRRRWIPLAAAAALLAASGLGFWLRRDAVPAGARHGATGAPAAIATIEAQRGEAHLERSENGAIVRSRATIGTSIPPGTAIELPADVAVGSTSVALRLEGGGSLRLDAGTRLTIEDRSRVRLERGAIYVDSGPERAAGIRVATAAGMFRDVGTQFEVRLETSVREGERPVARLRVREGAVVYLPEAGASEASADEAALVAGRGEQIRIGASGEIARSRVPLHGPDWAWTRASAPPLAIEGIRARRFLDWLAREEGLELELENAEVAEIAERVVLHGDISGLAPEEVPGAVLASCGLVYRIENGRLVIAVRTAS